MHICFLCNEYPPHPHGGVGTVTQTLARSLVSHGHRASVVGLYAGQGDASITEDDNGVEVIRLAHTTLRGAGFIVNRARLGAALFALHQRRPIDVIEGPESSLALAPTGLPARTVIRMNGGHHFFATTLGESPRAWRSWLERRSFSRADHLCAVSRFVANTTLDLLGRSGERIEILPNPVDVTKFQPRDRSSEEEGLVLFVGTLTEKKGVRQLVMAMPQIVEAAPHARLEIVGRDRCDPKTGRSFSDDLRSVIPEHLRSRITLRGPIANHDLPGVIGRAAVCVYPSHMEALPLAWLEGMAMGKAIVASETGPGPEVIEHGVSGLLCDPHDPRSIADRVITMLQNADLRRQLGAQARARAVSEFSESVLFGRNLRFYERCAAEAVA